MGTPLRYLLVEDNANDAELIAIELERAGYDLQWERVETEEALGEALHRGGWQLVISDFAMPHFDGLRAFDIVRNRDEDLPFIFVSGALGEERAVAAMLAGARDYILKGNLVRLPGAVRRELEEADNRRRKHEAEQDAEQQQRRLATAVAATGTGIFDYWLDGEPHLYLSPRCAELAGLTVAELPDIDGIADWVLARVHEEDVDAVGKAYREFAAGRTDRLSQEVRVRHADGQWLTVEAVMTAARRDDDGGLVSVVGSVLDITERRRLEAQFLQSQKMEAVGRLAGGIAHDFNNVLTAIFAFGKFVLDELDSDDRIHDDMQEVLSAGERAASLTSQLLAFSRRKAISPRVLNLNPVIGDMERMTRRVLGEDVALRTVLSPDLWNVRIDADVFSQVLVNLAINARDAMPGGGELSIETDNVTVGGAGRPPEHRVDSGDYVLVTVADTGTGMPKEVQAQIFEPFFTTKKEGQGTGLGLSTCYGIIKQAEGDVTVTSKLGGGTTFRIYLPRVIADVDRQFESIEPASVKGVEVVLVAEDNEQVRVLIKRILVPLGYTVLEAADGVEALEMARTWDQPIDLLLSDVIMPEMSGKQLAEQLSALQPLMKVAYMSGYTAETIAHRGMLDAGTRFIPKPFAPSTLAHEVRKVLDTDDP